jgi:hypothetical protein
MKIKFRQSGGFTGLTRSIEIDLNEITVQEAESLKSLVDQSRFFNLQEPVNHAMPDEEQIFINIDMKGRSKSIFLGKSELPVDLKPLVKYLLKRAKYEKREK